jgi:hypothetical protein
MFVLGFLALLKVPLDLTMRLWAHTFIASRSVMIKPLDQPEPDKPATPTLTQVLITLVILGVMGAVAMLVGTV